MGSDLTDSKHIIITDNHIKDTNLKRIRSSYGCTQAELSKRSGVSLRSIQMYEQRNKDINKASSDTYVVNRYWVKKILQDITEIFTMKN